MQRLSEQNVSISETAVEFPGIVCLGQASRLNSGTEDAAHQADEAQTTAQGNAVRENVTREWREYLTIFSELSSDFFPIVFLYI